MNKIENKFYNAFTKYYKALSEEELLFETVTPQYPIGIYIVDFAFFTGKDLANFIVEIDGQESHKTKEQRYRDYQRERFLQQEGFIIVRFTGSEVFVNAEKCVKDFMKIVNQFYVKINQSIGAAYDCGTQEVK